MKRREIQAEGTFTSELAILLPNAKVADEILDGATLALWYMAEEIGIKIPDTDIYCVMASDFPNKRFLAVFYTIDNGCVSLQSVKAVAI